MALTLAIETATAACSAALIDGATIVAERHELVGRGHAERLVPMIAELLDGRRPDAILVDAGPGSFTGVRVGLAAARGLALAWGAELHGFSSLALLAAQSAQEGVVVAALPGGHGELFVQRFAAAPLRPLSELLSLPPDAALAFIGSDPIVGAGAALLGRDTAAPANPPRAANVVLLPAALASLAPSPLYGRAPDAKMPA
ncbi:tRNA (adenosine(37)-N6)-threonylcarbamoyltransferase complex dimerization subunit type 1 TsaB [Sphingomonas jatrophae]|uniref:tRNA threonylcarbamoyl adenosine modification protein YeaZ n=1 Tax=Sphingomonas jatrophae TaxID=1166337 RepID=A0A1I6M978_9SPHN|nr:tRNA (adenosine(37)-N6)-threonylcarbamoyltransferase complex dimerization subunit type 1 TsaB [Sphingomonas jatrophae]SFS12284.1 tRNA threonylcarbamoyl adenosine modification protein YeaZ [Sphingomonas jatrophae]